MPSHVHLIMRSKEGKPDFLLGEMKRYTSNKLQELISQNTTESRKEWILWMMEKEAKDSSNV